VGSSLLASRAARRALERWIRLKATFQAAGLKLLQRPVADRCDSTNQTQAARSQAARDGLPFHVLRPTATVLDPGR